MLEHASYGVGLYLTCYLNRCESLSPQMKNRLCLGTVCKELYFNCEQNLPKLDSHDLDEV